MQRDRALKRNLRDHDGAFPPLRLNVDDVQAQTVLIDDSMHTLQFVGFFALRGDVR